MPCISTHILAFRRFATETVCFRISGKTSADSVDGGAKCRALVRQIEPDVTNIGNAGSGERWTVRFVVSDLTSFNRVAIGTVIERDRINNAWPILTVKERPKIKDGICTLTCSANEIGGK